MNFHVPREHPCFAGHFPGNPLVPAVVVLEHVIALAERHLRHLGSDERVQGVLQAKFVRVLGPDEQATVTFSPRRGGLGFDVAAGSADGRQATVARGTLALGRAE